MFSSIIISNAAAARCRKGELWLLKSDVVGRKPNLPGIVELLDKGRRFVGMAFISPESRYYLRIFSTTKVEPDREFWRLKIARAFEKRGGFLKITDAYRVIHSEADGIPSVVIDKYNDVWVLQATSSGAETIKKNLIDIISMDYGPSAVVEIPSPLWGEGKPARRASKLACEAGGGEGDRCTVFGSRTKTIIKELDQRFEVDILRGQKTGAYLDYRAFRMKAREFARGRCLDAFCYQGWFSCQIASASSGVVAIDSSANAIAAAKKNAERNGHTNIEFVKADVFDYLKGSSDSFDFIHLDPPSFAKGGGKLDAAVRGYKKLIAAAERHLNPGGIFMISSCSHAVTEGVLERTTTKCLKDCGRKCDIIYRGIQDIDHPVLSGHPESLYLKAIAIKVCQ